MLRRAPSAQHTFTGASHKKLSFIARRVECWCAFAKLCLHKFSGPARLRGDTDQPTNQPSANVAQIRVAREKSLFSRCALTVKAGFMDVPLDVISFLAVHKKTGREHGQVPTDGVKGELYELKQTPFGGGAKHRKVKRFINIKSCKQNEVKTLCRQTHTHNRPI